MKKRNQVSAVLSLVIALSFMGCEFGAASATTEGDSSSTTSSSSSSTLTGYAYQSSLKPGGSTYVYAVGGVSPYTYTLYSGGGSVDANGYFVAPAYDTTATLRIKDANGTLAYLYISVSASLTMTPASKTIYVNDAVSFATTGGTAPYSYTLSGDGSLSGVDYKAPSSAGSATVVVTDALGRTATTVLTIQARGALEVYPSSATIQIYDSQELSVSGGRSPYTYSMLTGDGQVSYGYYLAPDHSTVARVRVTDADGRTAVVTLTVKNSALEDSCLAYQITDTTGAKRSGSLVSVANQTVCSVPIPYDATASEMSTCPSGWNTVRGGSLAYTITEAKSAQESVHWYSSTKTVYTGYHSSFQALARECITICTSRNITGCRNTGTFCAPVRNIACTQ